MGDNDLKAKAIELAELELLKLYQEHLVERLAEQAAQCFQRDYYINEHGDPMPYENLGSPKGLSEPATAHACPNCGYCPACGRSDRQPYPYQQPIYPAWPRLPWEAPQRKPWEYDRIWC